MSKHTLGPWRWGTDENGYSLRSYNGSRVLTIRDGVIPMNDDAALIAAAPDLLAAIKDLHDACEHWDNQNDPVLRSARAAIAKAEGR